MIRKRIFRPCNVTAFTAAVVAYCLAFSCAYKLKAEPAQPGTVAPNLGWNLQGNSEYATDGAWRNARMVFLPWGKPDRGWDANPNLRLSENGYPLADATAFSYMRGYRKGVFAFAMKGSGQVTFSRRLRLIGELTRDDQDVLRGQVDFDPGRSSYAEITIRNIDPNDPPRDLELNAPDAPEGATFRTPFIERIKTGIAVRFMDWGRTNGHPFSFANRVKPDHWNHVGSGGTSIEYMIDLCNEADIDGWYCVPHTYGRDDIRAAAELWASRLEPGRALYVEWSNETWNPGFGQQKPMRTIAEARADLPGPGLDRLWQYIAEQTVIAGDSFRLAFAHRQADIRPVYAGQAANPYVLEVGLKYLASKYGDINRRVWGLSIARYWSHDDAWEWNTETKSVRFPDWSERQWADAILAETMRNVATPGERAQRNYGMFRALSEKYRLVPVAYEGGQHIMAENQVARTQVRDFKVNAQAKLLAQSLPQMGDVYATGVKAVSRDVSPHLFMHFTLSSTWSDMYWGALNDIDQAGSPKFDTLVSSCSHDATSIPQPSWAGEIIRRQWQPGEVWPEGNPGSGKPSIVTTRPSGTRRIRRIVIDFTDGTSEEISHTIER
jgi:hypothetical protein